MVMLQMLKTMVLLTLPHHHALHNVAAWLVSQMLHLSQALHHIRHLLTNHSCNLASPPQIIPIFSHIHMPWTNIYSPIPIPMHTHIIIPTHIPIIIHTHTGNLAVLFLTWFQTKITPSFLLHLVLTAFLKLQANCILIEIISINHNISVLNCIVTIIALL
jgi:hypothetical protein